MRPEERAQVLYSYLMNSHEVYGRQFAIMPIEEGQREVKVIFGREEKTQIHIFLVLTEGEAMQAIEQHISFNMDSILYETLAEFSRAVVAVGKERFSHLRNIACANKKMEEFNSLLQNLMRIDGRWNEFLEVVGQRCQCLLAKTDGEERTHVFQDTKYYIYKTF